MISFQKIEDRLCELPVSRYDGVVIPRFLSIKDKEQNLILKYDGYIKHNRHYRCYGCNYRPGTGIIFLFFQDVDRKALCDDCFVDKLKKIDSTLIVPNSRDPITFNFIYRFSKDNFIYAIWLHIMWKKYDAIPLPKDIIGEITRYILSK